MDYWLHDQWKWRMGLTKGMLALATAAFAAAFGSSLALGVETGRPTASPAKSPGIRLTLEGPVYVDDDGMTLYRGSPTCDNSLESPVRLIQAEGAVPFEVSTTRTKSCLTKNPPFLAHRGSRQFGEWSIIDRVDGTRQWALEGTPLFRSSKDHQPGDINGGYLVRLGRYPSPIAFAPMDGLPPGITTSETSAGLTFVDHQGRALYYRSATGLFANCDRKCMKNWRPLTAPSLAQSVGDEWTIETSDLGIRQWAYKGRGLYTYAFDAPKHSEQVFGDTFGGTWAKPIDGWTVAVVKKPAPLPPHITVQTLPGEPQLFSFGLPRVVYANAKGRTLYTVHCLEGRQPNDEPEGAVEMACDDVGDNPLYWHSFCGGEELCRRTWQTVPASSAEVTTSGEWGSLLVNPKNPFAPLKAGKGTRVLTYYGRPVFTYVHDTLPGDFYGDDHGFGTTGNGQMQARPIPAHHHGPGQLPVMIVTPK